MKGYKIISIVVFMFLSLTVHSGPVDYVRCMMGTGGHGAICPIAVAPFGMVQLGPDTRLRGNGYKYSDKKILGFSHVHKSGGGCSDFLDIMFTPIVDPAWSSQKTFPEHVASNFSHDNEYSEPGYYRVQLLDFGVEVELTATERCGMHRYTYPQGVPNQVVVDLKHGSVGSCSIFSEENFDTVKISHIEIIEPNIIKGYRISNGWAPTQHVYFYAEFSKKIVSYKVYDKNVSIKGSALTGTDLKALLQFDDEDNNPVLARVGISPVSIEGAMNNLNTEIATWNFDAIRKQTKDKWNMQLSSISINDKDSKQKEIFYTSLYFASIYPQLYSDVTGEFRSSDCTVHKSNFRYFAGVLGLWDTFRAQNPLVAILRPDVTNDLLKTFLEHYNHFGQLPMWTLAGQETLVMLGYHAMPVIADAYYKGIRDYDVNALYDAMKTSATKDTFGYWVRDYRGTINYLKYEYVPCDKELSSVSKTLEYAYDDWCIAQMAKMLGKKQDYDYYIKRAGFYKNVFDSQSNMFRGRFSDRSWRTPFNRFYCDHYHSQLDDFAEATAWVYAFSAQHDGRGLVNLMGGKEAFSAKLDSLFIQKTGVDLGNASIGSTGISGFMPIGQYQHGNEQSHHNLYMYNHAGKPWKAQYWINKVLYSMYDTSPEGIIGNDDTGQMSAWYVFSALGFYPVSQGDGVYLIGTPIFKEVKWKHSGGTLLIKAANVSQENKYIQSAKLNGKTFTKNWLQHNDIFKGNATLEFEMGNIPNKKWGSADSDLPPSMTDEVFN